MAKKDLVPIRFACAYGKYFAGDIAGFSPSKAKEICDTDAIVEGTEIKVQKQQRAVDQIALAEGTELWLSWAESAVFVLP